MDQVDLTLKLSLPSIQDDDHPDEVPQDVPQHLNAHGSYDINQGLGFGSAVSAGNAHASQYSAMSITDFQRSVSVTERRQQRLTPPTEMREFCVLNVSHNKGKVGGSRKKNTTRCQRPAPKIDNQNRTCTNFNCRVSETPMWRRGPLGPKTLCNACGIKYRKLKLKEKEGEGTTGESSSN